MLIYGPWAAFVNLDHGPEMALRAGLGQGAYAFVSTWLITGTARAALARLGYHSLALVLSFLITFCLMLSIPLLLHALLGTADVWEAILPGLLWGSGYIFFVLWIDLRSYKTRGETKAE
tara:strand:- start:224 stop:580 length:357 start_codon:yes stop_codon:yes gene_type:complete